MKHLTRGDYAAALRLIGELERASDAPEHFAREGARLLSSYVAAELTTLSVCDLATGHREVIGLPALRLGPDEIAAFDRHFYEHPLVRYHGIERGPGARRISDSMGPAAFRNTALYDEYYRRVGLHHAIAVPLQQDGRMLVSFVLNRAHVDFSERDRERLELLRPHLVWLYAQVCRVKARAAETVRNAPMPALPDAPIAGELTPREREVLAWLAHGKTDAEIAAFLGTSPRTVHKHLEHIYVKLGVETRTAAVMRGFGMAPPAP
ncbi:helix-turn-helix transcriptional regulator [Caldimonas sp. KR1-144]|uniref:helix-turn-helix transcriptional regulator n=1 Tax=Caldimonas sp. KR1-144 TaxID=3400911 RepID=UPI003C03C917